MLCKRNFVAVAVAVALVSTSLLGVDSAVRLSSTRVVVPTRLTAQSMSSVTNVKKVKTEDVVKSSISVTAHATQSIRESVAKESSEMSCKFVPLGDFILTGYCPCKICCEQFAGDPATKCTSIGVHAYEGVTVAVDPTKIPYGTKLYIEGYGVRIASDCGDAIKGNHLDIYFASHSVAEAVGRKTAKVWRIED